MAPYRDIGRVNLTLTLWGRLRLLAYEVSIALAAMVSGVIDLVNHRQPLSLAVAYGFVAWAWDAAYAVGGLLVLYGVCRPRLKAEAVGSVLLAVAFLVQGWSFFALPDRTVDQILPTLVLLVGLAGAAMSRFFFLVRAERHPLTLRLEDVGDAEGVGSEGAGSDADD